MSSKRDINYELDTLYISSFDFYMDSKYKDEEYDDWYKERFEVNIFVYRKIRKFLKAPPSGSRFETEWSEHERSNGTTLYHPSLKYMYKEYLKSHVTYAKKIDRLIDTKKFYQRCKKDFDAEYEKYVNKLKREEKNNQ